MTHYLRIIDLGTLAKIEATESQVQTATIMLTIFAQMRDVMVFRQREEFTEEVQALLDLRRQYSQFNGPGTPDQFVERRCKAVAKKWNLDYLRSGLENGDGLPEKI